MNLPDWATHVAVDCDGGIYAFSAKPVPSTSNSGNDWVWDNPPGVRYEYVAAPDVAKRYITPEVARLLCVAIPRPEREEKTDVENTS